MNIVYAEEFQKEFKKLPSSIRQLYRRQEARFREHWNDPRLHVKKLHGDEKLFSFRITRAYRVLFKFVDVDTAFFATIGGRKDIYR